MAIKKEIRICTVNANGKRYIVQQLALHGNDPAANFAHVWGEVTEVKGAATRHNGSKKFRMDKVTISTVAKTPELCTELFHQAIDAKREAGHAIHASRTGRTFTDHGTPLQRARRADANFRFSQDSGFQVLNRTLGKLGRELPTQSKPAFIRELWALASEAECKGLEGQMADILAIIEAHEG